MTERLALCDDPISEEEFAETYGHLQPYLEEVDRRGERVTYFETLTMLAQTWFAERAVDAQLEIRGRQIADGLAVRPDDAHVHLNDVDRRAEPLRRRLRRLQCPRGRGGDCDEGEPHGDLFYAVGRGAPWTSAESGYTLEGRQSGCPHVQCGSACVPACWQCSLQYSP